MIATGAIHITMDVTANFVITPDISSPDGDAKTNIKISAVQLERKKIESKQLLAHTHAQSKQLSKACGWIGEYISARKIWTRSFVAKKGSHDTV
jgi:hypothetical protein